MSAATSRSACALAAVLLLASCGGERAYYRDEHFTTDARHRREFTVAPDVLCSATRRALLGQGYLVASREQGKAVALLGQKEFKMKELRHAVLQVQAECSPAANGATLYVAAVESHFDAAETTERTGIGVMMLTPLPITSTTTWEGQLKLSGDSVEDSAFYDAFFQAVQRELGAP